MSNLSDLLPAGAGAKSADFVASGTLSSGQTVALNSNGTVEVVSGTTSSIGSVSAYFQTSSSNHYIKATYDTANNKVVVVYRAGGNNDYGTAVVGSVSGSTITWGTPVVFESASVAYTSCVFDAANNKIVIAYSDFGNPTYGAGTAIVGTVSGTSMTFGSPVVFENASTEWCSVVFDSNSNKAIIVYRDSPNVDRGTAIVGTVSGTGISFGSPVVYSSGTTDQISSTFDSTSNKVIIAYRNISNSQFGTAIVGTVSGTSISFGSAVVFNSGATTNTSCAYDATAQKTVIAFVNVAGGGLGEAVVGSISGTSISFGSAVTFSTITLDSLSIAFDFNVNRMVIAYRDTSAPPYSPVALIGLVSGTTISFEFPVITLNNANNEPNGLIFDPDTNQMIVVWRAGVSGGQGIALTVGATNNTSFIGITDQAIADGASGKVVVQGGVSEKVTSLTANTDYYVQADGSISTTVSTVPAGKALSSTSILLKG